MSIIDKENEVWKTFVGFRSVFETEAKELGIDIFGTDKIESVAVSLTLAHFLNSAKKELEKSNKREDVQSRRAFHIDNKSTFKEKNG